MTENTCIIIEDGARCMKPVFMRKRGWCSMHYARWVRNGDPLAYRQWPSIEERFWSKVNKDGPIPAHMPHLGPCWVWTAGTFDKGYGLFRLAHAPVHAHRISWELANGPIPDETPCVLHRCDNQPCIRPTHLFLGTIGDNNADRDAKGRGRYGVNRDPAAWDGVKRR